MSPLWYNSLTLILSLQSWQDCFFCVWSPCLEAEEYVSFPRSERFQAQDSHSLLGFLITGLVLGGKKIPTPSFGIISPDKAVVERRSFPLLPPIIQRKNQNGSCSRVPGYAGNNVSPLWSIFLLLCPTLHGRTCNHPLKPHTHVVLLLLPLPTPGYHRNCLMETKTASQNLTCPYVYFCNKMKFILWTSIKKMITVQPLYTMAYLSLWIWEHSQDFFLSYIPPPPPHPPIPLPLQDNFLKYILHQQAQGIYSR